MSMIPEFIVFVRQVKCLLFVDMARRWLFSLFLSLCMLGSIYLCSSLLIMHAYRIDLFELDHFFAFPPSFLWLYISLPGIIFLLSVHMMDCIAYMYIEKSSNHSNPLVYVLTL